MATKKRKPRVPRNAPTAIGHYPQPQTSDGKLRRAQLLGGAFVTLFSENPEIVVEGRLRAPVSSPLPRPQIETVPRPGAVGLTHWTGRDPYELVLPIEFTAFPDGSVEKRIGLLENLALRHAGHTSPPRVQIAGPVPFPAGLAQPQWWISDLQEVPERTFFNGDGRRARFAVDVTLREYVHDRLLAVSGRAGEGIKNRQAKIRAGESLHDFAKRVLHDRSKAADIARANSIPLSKRFPKAATLRLP